MRSSLGRRLWGYSSWGSCWLQWTSLLGTIWVSTPKIVSRSTQWGITIIKSFVIPACIHGRWNTLSNEVPGFKACQFKKKYVGSAHLVGSLRLRGPLARDTRGRADVFWIAYYRSSNKAHCFTYRNAKIKIITGNVWHGREHLRWAAPTPSFLWKGFLCNGDTRRSGLTQNWSSCGLQFDRLNCWSDILYARVEMMPSLERYAA